MFFLKKKLRQENIKKLATISPPFILLRFCNSIHPPLTECPASSSHDVKNNSFLSKLHHRVASLSSLPSLPSPYWLMHGNIIVAHFDCWAPLGSTGQLQNASRSLREELQLQSTCSCCILLSSPKGALFFQMCYNNNIKHKHSVSP